MARGKGKYGPKSKILVVLKSAHHKFLENALSKLIFSKVENGTPYSIHLLASNYSGLEVSKKVRYISVAQSTSDLQHVKVYPIS